MSCVGLTRKPGGVRPGFALFVAPEQLGGAAGGAAEADRLPRERMRAREGGCGRGANLGAVRGSGPSPATPYFAASMSALSMNSSNESVV